MEKHICRIDTNKPAPPDAPPENFFTPGAAIMVTCISKDGRPNIIPLTGWGILCRYPLIFGIAICQGHYTKDYFPRYSHQLLHEVPEFVVNIPHAGMRDAISVCGSLHGPAVDKFSAACLHPEPSIVVRPPAIAECPLNYECIVRDVVKLGSHDAFMGEAVAFHTAIQDTLVDEDINKMLLTPENGESRIMNWRALPWF